MAPPATIAVKRDPRLATMPKRPVGKIASPIAAIMKYLLLAIPLLFSAIPVTSQQPLVGLIQGMVVDQKDAPIPRAALIATNIDSVEPASHRHLAATDKMGIYQFVDVPMGRYSIVVRKNGYRDYQIPEVTVRGGEMVNLPDIRMSPASSR
jgi:Carboxypeptidase regulatory-like domain